MPSAARPQQTDLFADSQTRPAGLRPEVPESFVARIREELLDTLSRVEGASALPWPDMTQALLAELRFDSIAGWLPPAEATSLRARFEAAVTTMYEVIESA